MPNRRKQGLMTVARLLLDMFRVSAERINVGKGAAEALEIRTIMFAVMLGHLESRPMSALKVSNYIGVPRATVTRKLQALCDLGHVMRDERGLYLVTSSYLGRAELTQYLKRTAQLIHKASSELSKMGTL